MESMKFIFRAGNTELILPVTPPSFEVNKGIRVETVNIHGVGDIRVAGYSTLDNVSIASFFPAKEYSFAQKSREPYEYAALFASWAENKTVVRFLISGTTVNIPVLIENIRYGEQDGSGDVYYTLTLAEYRYVSVAATASRPVETIPVTAATHVVEEGECLRNITRRYTGTSEQKAVDKVAKASGIQYPNTIRPGDVVSIPNTR